ncbi:nitroreductase [Pigmentiphaga sp. H8]|uniref:nitroreductase n=1 Tax=unclassified Pigmentiphaga TaxID=2626614 RepID=UPI000F5ABCE9|nr:nitroreductase [Pigmentiphaga sp. H8]AZG07248.1 nitroreductase [Pigmentiphaga sp. H8]
MTDHADDYASLTRLLNDRWSCRGFLPEQLPRDTIQRILALTQRTASWCNTQPWEVIVTAGAGTERFRRALFDHVMSRPQAHSDFPFPREYPGVYRERRRECGFQLYDSVGVQRGDREASARQGAENFRFFGAPHVAIITTPEALDVYGAVDCGAYVGNFMLAARSLGVATIAQAALAEYSSFIRDHFGIAPGRKVVCGISFGFADPGHPANGFRTSRAAVDDVVRWMEE